MDDLDADAPPTRVVVAAVVRPLLEHEFDGSAAAVTVSRSGAEPRVCLSNGQSFYLDHAFGAEAGGAAQDEIFGACVSPLVDGCLSGFNASILAFGQTGSGKTYTMGTAAGAQQGVVPSAVSHLFARLSAAQREGTLAKATVSVTFVELYNEEIRDLLCESRNAPPLQLRDVPGGGGLAELPDARALRCGGPADVGAALAQGALLRATASTAMNGCSSRSHAVLTLHIHLSLPEGASLRSKLQLVDLAGSERLKRTGAEGSVRGEGVAINQALLALGNVVAALDERSQNPRAHIPYRASKLTRLLQEGLGGNARTLMLVCVSPAASNLTETTNTLAYGARARRIVNAACANADCSDDGENEVGALKAALAASMEELQLARRSGGGGGRALGDALCRADAAEARCVALGRALAGAEEEATSSAAQAMDATLRLAAVSAQLRALQRSTSSGSSEGAEAEDKENELGAEEAADASADPAHSAPDAALALLLRRQGAEICALRRRLRALSAGAPAPLAELSLSEFSATDSPPEEEEGGSFEGDDFIVADDGTGEPPLDGSAAQAQATAQLAALDAELAATEAALSNASAGGGGSSSAESSEESERLRRHYEKVVGAMEGEREVLQTQLTAALGGAPPPGAPGRGADRVAEATRVKLRQVEAQLADVKAKLRTASAAEAQRRAAAEEAKRLQIEVARVKAARIELLRQMQVEARARGEERREAQRTIAAERKAAAKSERAARTAEAARSKAEAVLKRKTEDVASAMRLISNLARPRSGASSAATAAAMALSMPGVAAGLCSDWQSVQNVDEARDMLRALAEALAEAGARQDADAAAAAAASSAAAAAAAAGAERRREVRGRSQPGRRRAAWVDPVEGPMPTESAEWATDTLTVPAAAPVAEAAPMETVWGLRGGETPVVTAKGKRPPFRLISPAPNAALMQGGDE